MASPAFSFCAAVENSVQMLFIEIETDPYTATRLAGNDLEICKLTYGTRKELFQIRLRDIPDLLAVIINADGGISLVVVCIIGEIIELAVLLDFAENILTIAPYAVVVIECHADELKRNIVAICVEPLSALGGGRFEHERPRISRVRLARPPGGRIARLARPPELSLTGFV